MKQRKNQRLKDFDYSSENFYFLTICIHNRIKILSKVVNDKIFLNGKGKMIQKWILEIENKFPKTKIHYLTIMPDHLHLILELKDNKFKVSEIIQWFKTMSTNEYIRNVKNKNWKQFDKKLWQRSYYDRIIRNEKEFEEICKYTHFNYLKKHGQTHRSVPTNKTKQ